MDGWRRTAGIGQIDEQKGEREGDDKDWQCRQAVKAVELYQKLFCTATAAHDPEVPACDKESSLTAAEKVYADMRELIRLRHYSYRTEQTYLDWVRRYFSYALAHNLHWQTSDSAKAFLSCLATNHDVAASTQSQAFSALLFLLRDVLKQDNPDMASVRARQGSRLPVVLSVEEVRQVLRSGTSVGANYREAYRARSKMEFVAKVGDCLKELEETSYWFELLADSGIVQAADIKAVHGECNELLAILTTISKRTKTTLS